MDKFLWVYILFLSDFMRQNVSGLVCLKICLFFSHIWIIVCSTCISLKPDKSMGSVARLSVFESLYLLTSCVTLGNLFNIFVSSLPSLKNEGYTKYPLHQLDKKIKRGNSFKKTRAKPALNMLTTIII